MFWVVVAGALQGRVWLLGLDLRHLRPFLDFLFKPWVVQSLPA